MSALSVVTINQELLPFKSIVLRQQSGHVDIGSPSALGVCKSIALEMFDLMYSSDGAGLAAPQVGIALRLVVMDPANLDFGPHVLINPEVLYSSTEEEEGIEGCLSLPRLNGKVMRSTQVHVRAYNLMGEIEEYKVEGWLARVFQHELDHLNGMLYPDRMNEKEKLITVTSGYRRRANRVIKDLTELRNPPLSEAKE